MAGDVSTPPAAFNLLIVSSAGWNRVKSRSSDITDFPRDCKQHHCGVPTGYDISICVSVNSDDRQDPRKERTLECSGLLDNKTCFTVPIGEFSFDRNTHTRIEKRRYFFEYSWKSHDLDTI